jgi:small multidrug resistance family-3 protein
LSNAWAIGIFSLAAVFEIAGCFAFWAVVRMGKTVWWLVPGTVALLAFAYLLALTPSTVAGRSFATYGGIYICASLLWMWAIESKQPDKFDLLGAAICLMGAAIIFWSPHRSN